MCAALLFFMDLHLPDAGQVDVARWIFARLELQKQKLQLIHEEKVTSDVLFDVSFVSEGNPVDYANVSDLKLVPKLNERDLDTFFLMF